jgi:hypothetical protein
VQVIYHSYPRFQSLLFISIRLLRRAILNSPSFSSITKVLEVVLSVNWT